MILGELASLKNYTDTMSYNLIVSLIDKVKLNTVPVGEWIILNEDIKGVVLTKSGYNEGVFEAHSIYNDIHIVIEGQDTIYLGDKYSSVVKSVYDEKGDYTLYNSQICSTVKMNKNMFAFIAKEEIHTNQIEGDLSKKIVIKLK